MSTVDELFTRHVGFMVKDLRETRYGLTALTVCDKQSSEVFRLDENGDTTGDIDAALVVLDEALKAEWFEETHYSMEIRLWMGVLRAIKKAREST